MLHLKLLENQEPAEPISKQKEILKIMAKISEIETKYRESTKHKVGSSKKTNKIDQPLINLTKRKREDPNK
jgi:hypothetical protein